MLQGTSKAIKLLTGKDTASSYVFYLSHKLDQSLEAQDQLGLMTIRLPEALSWAKKMSCVSTTHIASSLDLRQFINTPTKKGFVTCEQEAFVESS